MRNNDHRPDKQTLPNRIAAFTQPNKAYPVMDGIIMVYFAIIALFQILFQISPSMSFFSTTPLYSIQTYMGILGGGLIVVDFFTSKRLWRGAYSVLLYGICALAAVASVRTISYGIRENLFKLCWAAIQFAIFYSFAYRMEKEKLKKYFTVMYGVLLAIWIVACCVSLYQYANQIGYMYVVNPLAKDSSATRQGFYDNRLFGIFYTLNHAAFISTMFFAIGLIYALAVKKIWVRILLAVTEFILLCHIVLSGSRSAYVALIAAMLCLAWFVARNLVRQGGWRKVVLPIVAAALAAALTLAAYQGLKSALTLVPYLNTKFLSAHTEPTQASTETGQTAGETEEATEATTQTVEYDENVLHRENLEEDASNGRLSIWKDYISLYKEVGLVGLSPGNYMSYIFEHHPEMYIVEYIRVNYPDKYESGIIYHVHSGYLAVYVGAGLLGAVLLAAFIVLCLLRLARKILGSPTVSYMLICTFLLVLIGSISAVFDEGLFFQNNPHTTMFWIALGILMKECSDAKTCD